MVGYRRKWTEDGMSWALADNFLFEEANVDRHGSIMDNDINCDNSGASHSIVHYARSLASNVGDALRRKDESCCQKWLERKEHRAVGRRAKEEKPKRLKNARREELEGRMERVCSMLGYDRGGDAAYDDDAADEPLATRMARLPMWRLCNISNLCMFLLQSSSS